MRRHTRWWQQMAGDKRCCDGGSHPTHGPQRSRWVRAQMGLTQLALLLLVLLAMGACQSGEAPSAASKSDSDAYAAKGNMFPAPEMAATASPAAPGAAASAAPEADAEGVAGKLRMAVGKPGKDGKKTTKVTTWKRSQALPHSSKLMVGDKESLALRALQLKARVDGFRARVVLDYYYANTSDRSYEGTFKMRLPNGASPYFFAFGETGVSVAADQGKPELVSFERARKMGVAPGLLMKEREGSWQKPKEARMVPRAKAARAYGDTVRQKVDPALMEWSGAGVFSARVFPLAAGKLHRIVVGYDVDLLAVGDELVLQTPLPADVPQLTVDYDVALPIGTATTFTDGAKTVDIAGRRYARFNQPKAQQLSVRIKQDRPWMLVGQDDAVGHHYATSFMPKLPASTAVKGAPNAVLLLDTSLSSNPDKFNVWLKLAETLLTDNRDALKSFAVMFFDVRTRWYRDGFIANTPENVSQLLTDAQALVLEGATDLSAALRETGRFVEQQNVSADVFLLSDGAATWGEQSLYAMSRSLQNAPLFAYRTGMSGSDDRALTQLARETGGAVFSVVGEAEVKRAARAHRQRPWRLLEVELKGAGEVLLAGRPSALFAGQRLRVVGRGEPEGPLVLTLQQGDVKRQVSTEFAQLGSKLTPRSYGMVAVEQLEALENAAEKLATAYASHYRVTGKSCSLLMLESEADYRARGIVPDKTHVARIKQRTAAAAVRQTLAEIEQSLGDPKAGFLRWLEQLRHTPGAEVKLSPSFAKQLQKLPARRFAVPSQPLVVEQQTRDGIDAGFLSRLAQRKIDYDVFVREAERRREQHGAQDALKTFSSMVENSPGDTVLARDVAAFASQHGLGTHAFHLLRRVAHARPYEPQTYLGMARAAAQAGRPELAMAYYEIGLSGSWDARFGEYRRIVSLQYVRLLRDIIKGGDSDMLGYAQERLARLQRELDLGEADIVVVMMWNTDNTDIDLHVVEPTGERCHYAYRDTKIGGHMTEDVTEGYGPEMYTLKRAPKGRYRIEAKYFSSDRSRASVRTKVQALVFRNWGRPNETMIEKVITLAHGKQMHDITVIER